MARTKADRSNQTGRFSYDGLGRVIHEKARLGMLTSLMAHPDGLSFTELKEFCALTDGNLSRHLAVLHEAGLVEIRKGASGNRPQTVCRMTPGGRKKFLDYLAELERVIADAAEAAAAKGRAGPSWLGARRLPAPA
jgi:YD repeat-containing protein